MLPHTRTGGDAGLAAANAGPEDDADSGPEEDVGAEDFSERPSQTRPPVPATMHAIRIQLAGCLRSQRELPRRWVNRMICSFLFSRTAGYQHYRFHRRTDLAVGLSTECLYCLQATNG